MNLVRGRLYRAAKEVSGETPRDALMQLGAGELARAVDGHKHVELALSTRTSATSILSCGCTLQHTKGKSMSDHVYKVVEIVGSSETSIDDAIRRAVDRASQTLRNLRWFEVVQTRGHIENGGLHHFQVTVKIGFTMDNAG